MDIKHAHPIDRFFARNTASVVAVETFWGLALPLVVESTFLQLYLRSIGASATVIGLIPSLFALGLALAAPVSALLTAHLVHKKRAVVLTHVSASLPFIVYGALLLARPGAGRPAVFLAFYAVFTSLMGLTIPIWQNYLMRIFSPKKVFLALSVMYGVQVAARIAGGLAIAGAVKLFAFSSSGAALTFILVGACFLTGSMFFLFSHEKSASHVSARDRAHSLHSLVKTARRIIRERNFVWFLLNTLEGTACICVISFYANYAVEHRGVSQAVAAGLFTVFVYAGAVAANIFLGTMNLFSLKGKYIVSKFCALAGIALILAAPGYLLFLTASFFVGVSRGTSQLAFNPAVKAITGLEDSTDYFSMAPLLTLPFTVGIPWAAGAAIERWNGAGDLPYTAVFICMWTLVALSMLFVSKVDFGKKS